MRPLFVLLAFATAAPILGSDFPESLDCHEFFIGPPRDRVFATLRLGDDGKLRLETGIQAMQKDGTAGQTKTSRTFLVGQFTKGARHFYETRLGDYAEDRSGFEFDFLGIDPRNNVNVAHLRMWDGPFKTANADLSVKLGTRETTTPSLQCRRSP